MIPILFDANADPGMDNTGIGELTDAIECMVTEERNGLFELFLRYPVTGIHFKEIKQRSLIKARPAPYRTYATFRVYEITRPMNGIVSISARHISYDLSGIVAEPFFASSARQAMQMLQTETCPKNPFTMWTDKDTNGIMRCEIPTSVRSLLGGHTGSVLDCFGGEFEFTDTQVKLHTARGRNRGVTIVYGKNLTDLVQEENCANVRTGVYPFWTERIGIGDIVYPGQARYKIVTLPEKVIKAPGIYPFESIRPLDLTSKWETQPSEDMLRKEAERFVKENNVGVPKVHLRVSFAQLEQTEEYRHLSLLEQVQLCDTVNVSFPALGVKATAKCVRTVYNVLLNRMEKVELGEARSTLTDTISGNSQDIQDNAQNAENAGVDLQSQIDDIKANSGVTSSEVKRIASKITADILGATGGSLRMLDTNDDGEVDTLYIADSPDPDKAVQVWRFNYVGWAASNNGYNGPFTMAASITDGLYADFITAGTLTANLIKAGLLASVNGNFSLDLETGVCNIKEGAITLGTYKGFNDPRPMFHVDSMNSNVILGPLDLSGDSMKGPGFQFDHHGPLFKPQYREVEDRWARIISAPFGVGYIDPTMDIPIAPESQYAAYVDSYSGKIVLGNAGCGESELGSFIVDQNAAKARYNGTLYVTNRVTCDGNVRAYNFEADDGSVGQDVNYGLPSGHYLTFRSGILVGYG